MTGKGKPARRATVGALLTTSLLILIAIIAIFFALKGFSFKQKDTEFKGLVSHKDGEFLVPIDESLRIESISFNDFDRNRVPVEIGEAVGPNITHIILKELNEEPEFDILATLVSSSIDLATMPVVPQEVEVEVSGADEGDDIELYIFTDRPYESEPEGTSTESGNRLFRSQMGLKGVRGFIAVEETGIFITPGEEGGLDYGEGPLIILMAARLKHGKPVARSVPVAVKRKGIIHPDDVWFDEYRSGYFSLPFLGKDFETSRIVFTTTTITRGDKLIVSTLDYRYPSSVSGLFPEGPVVVDHWGKAWEDFDILFVRGLFNNTEKLLKVKVGQAGAVRVADDTPPETTPPETEKN